MFAHLQEEENSNVEDDEPDKVEKFQTIAQHASVVFRITKKLAEEDDDAEDTEAAFNLQNRSSDIQTGTETPNSSEM